MRRSEQNRCELNGALAAQLTNAYVAIVNILPQSKKAPTRGSEQSEQSQPFTRPQSRLSRAYNPDSESRLVHAPTIQTRNGGKRVYNYRRLQSRLGMVGSGRTIIGAYNPDSDATIVPYLAIVAYNPDSEWWEAGVKPLG